MPAAKKADTATAPKAKSASGHASYQDMIHDAIVQLKDRNGSSRQSLKKYVKANNNLKTTSDNMFDSLFNKALKSGVEKGIFQQPKGPSGGTKLAKKQPAPKAEGAAKKPTAKKAAAPKAEGAATAKKPAAKKAATAKTEKKPAAKKAAAPKKAAPATKKAEKPETVLTKTKSGRVAKTQKPAAAKKAAPKKAAPKKAAATKA